MDTMAVLLVGGRTLFERLRTAYNVAWHGWYRHITCVALVDLSIPSSGKQMQVVSSPWRSFPDGFFPRRAAAASIANTITRRCKLIPPSCTSPEV